MAKVPRLLLIVLGPFVACASADVAHLSAAEGMPMRLEIPRIQPLNEADWTPEQRSYLEPHAKAGRLFNVFKTAAHHDVASRQWDAFVFGHVNGDSNTLPPRHRELLILRIGWLCKSEYEWAAHTRVAHALGFTDKELIRVTEGPDSPDWVPFEAALLRAADQLHADAFISDGTWRELSAEYDTRQLTDVVLTVGAYNLVSMLLNTWGVQLDEGFTGFPESR